MRLPTQQELVRYSRDRATLVKASLVIVTVSVLLAIPVSLIPRRGIEGVEAGVTITGDGELISLIRFALPLPPESTAFSCAQLVKDGSENVFAGEIEAALAGPANELIAIWWKGLTSGSTVEAITQLEAADATARFRNEFMADLEWKSANPKAALRHYLAEAALFENAPYARRSALFLARFEEDRGLVRELLKDPSFLKAFAPSDLLRYHAYGRDYAGLARSVLLTEARVLGSPYLIPALFTAAIWFFILMAFRHRSRSHLIKAFAAFFLGIVSAALTLYTVVIQEVRSPDAFSPNDPAITQFFYFLSGVALREECLKLLCFLPIAIWIRRKESPIEALVLGGMVGLGFAFQENLLYFEAGSGTFTPWLRLLTANALHFSLTGVAGYYLWRMLSKRFRGWEEFLFSFLAVIIAHGLYNALLAMPAMADYSPLSPILVAIIAYQYFDPLRQHMETAGMHRRLSPLGIFVLGSVILTCTILVTSAAVQPYRFALGAFASSVGAMVPLSFAFISRFRDL